MNAIDTNVLLRIIVKDNEKQAQKALRYVEKSGEIFISLIVLCELSWVLSFSYDFEKIQIMQVIENILKTHEFTVEYSDLVWVALNEYRKHPMDFSDCLIGVVAKHYDFLKVGTFDKKATRSNLFELIE